jgi:hypothetical protein
MSCVDDGEMLRRRNMEERYLVCSSLLPRLRMAGQEEDDGITNPSTLQLMPTTASNVAKMAADLMVEYNNAEVTSHKIKNK